MSPARIGVTGASGFIGRHLVRHFAGRGDRVLAFQRGAAASTPPGVEVRPFTLPGGFAAGDFSGLDAIVHGALAEYGPAATNADELNREGARRLIDAARAHGVRVIFLSTLSAHPEAESHYGRSKLELESRFDPGHDTVLRLGLVLGHGGLFGGMIDTLRTARIVPLPDGGRQPIQTLWMGDLTETVANAIDRRISGRFDVAAPPIHTMRELYEVLMGALGVRPALVSVPLPLVQFGVSVLETLRVPFPIRTENVLGLKHLRAFDTAPSMRALGIEAPVPLRESVRRLLATG